MGFYKHIHFQLAAIFPLAVAHTLGNLLTNISLGKVAVSFTHTIKSMEPFFTVILSALFLGAVRDSTPFFLVFFWRFYCLTVWIYDLIVRNIYLCAIILESI